MGTPGSIDSLAVLLGCGVRSSYSSPLSAGEEAFPVGLRVFPACRVETIGVDDMVVVDQRRPG